VCNVKDNPTFALQHSGGGGDLVAPRALTSHYINVCSVIYSTSH